MDTARVAMMAEDLLRHHGVAAKGWVFRFDRARQRFGITDYSRREIRLSEVLIALNSEEEALDSILHEIAHALAGSAAAHGPRWQRVALRIGARPEATYDGAVVVLPESPLALFHPRCLYQYPVRRRSRARWVCPLCISQGVSRDDAVLTYRRVA